jgi:hypothetical protein
MKKNMTWGQADEDLSGATAIQSTRGDPPICLQGVANGLLIKKITAPPSNFYEAPACGTRER